MDIMGLIGNIMFPYLKILDIIDSLDQKAIPLPRKNKMNQPLITDEVQEAILNLARAICQYEGSNPAVFIREVDLIAMLDEQIAEVECENHMEAMGALQGVIHAECPWTTIDIISGYLMEHGMEEGVGIESFKTYFKEEVMG
jgi:hypothetical protein